MRTALFDNLPISRWFAHLGGPHPGGCPSQWSPFLVDRQSRRPPIPVACFSTGCPTIFLLFAPSGGPHPVANHLSGPPIPVACQSRLPVNPDGLPISQWPAHFPVIHPFSGGCSLKNDPNLKKIKILFNKPTPAYNF